MQRSSKGRFLCSGCNTPLCANCLASHPKLTCAEFQSIAPRDRSLEDLEFYETARKARYDRCANCSRFIEHMSGCSHMQCPCGHAFNFGSERFKGVEVSVAAVKRGASSAKRSALKAATSAYALEEADCEHDWEPYNSTIESSLLCHLCGKSKRCYQLACSKCYMRACPACQKNLH